MYNSQCLEFRSTVMNRRSFLKFFGIGLVASVATRAAKARVCERNVGTLRAIYPVNSIYISAANINPADLFGFGTWVRFGQGRTLVGVTDGADADFGTVQQTGGARTHTLTEAQMPSHTHTATGFTPQGPYDGNTFCGVPGNLPRPIHPIHYTGGGQAHNNLQPYITVFMWRRSA